MIRRPVRCVDAPRHRVRVNDRDAACEVFGLFLRCREHREVARLDARRKLARREHIQLVEVAARDADLELRAHVVLPDLRGLIGQPVDEVGDDDRALLLHHAAQCRDNGIMIVDAPDRLPHARVKGLHAE